MQRRSFLKSAAAVFPAAGLNAFALGQAAVPAAPDWIHPVEAGQDRFGEAHSLGFSTIRARTPRKVAVPNGPKMDAPTFARYDMKYVGPPLVAS